MNHRLLLSLSTTALLAVATPGLAQEVDWSGFYVGVNAGVSWGDTSLDVDIEPGTGGTVVIPPADVAGINQLSADDGNKSGFAGGVQGGYNWQIGSIVLGLETDFSFMDVDQHRTNTYQSTVVVTPPIVGAPGAPLYTIEQRVQSNWMWTIRPRLGYATGPMMFYVTGGLAFTEIDLKTSARDTRSPPNSAVNREEEDKTGWVLGLGGAYAFTPNWSVRGEWLYADFGNVDSFAGSGFARLESEAKVKANIIRLGVDYKF